MFHRVQQSRLIAVGGDIAYIKAKWMRDLLDLLDVMTRLAGRQLSPDASPGLSQLEIEANYVSGSRRWGVGISRLNQRTEPRNPPSRDLSPRYLER